MAAFSFNLPFPEQLAFFRAKLNLPTSRWDDVWKAAHDRAFMVAGAMDADLLQDLRDAVEGAIARGESLQDFRNRFQDIVDTHGWHGWTGEGTQAGFDWRTRVIYQTNMLTSHAAGRYAQLMDAAKKGLVWWRYVHNDSVIHPRPIHKMWGDERLTLRFDDPFWQTHFPPNGWGCRCRVVAEFKPGANATTTPPPRWNTPDPKTGEPPGIDKGWGYAPGAATDTSLREFVQQKLIRYDEAIGRALSRDVTNYVVANADIPAFVTDALDNPEPARSLWLGFVGNQAISDLAGEDLSNYLVLVPSQTPRHVQKSHGMDGQGQRLAQPEDYSNIPSLIESPDSIVLGTPGRFGQTRIVITKLIGGERYRSIWEVRPGKRNRALVLVTLVIKIER